MGNDCRGRGNLWRKGRYMVLEHFMGDTRRNGGRVLDKRTAIHRSTTKIWIGDFKALEHRKHSKK